MPLGVRQRVTTNLSPEFTRGSLATLDRLPPKLRRDPLRFNVSALFAMSDIFPNYRDSFVRLKGRTGVVAGVELRAGPGASPGP